MKKGVKYALIGAAVIIAAALIWLIDPFTFPELSEDRIKNAPCASEVYDAQGERIGTLSGAQNRIWISIDSLPEYVPNAFIAAEDQRFYDHSGIDVHRIFGAVINDIKTGSLSQGASTITQQLIKLTHLSSEKSIRRKAREAILALRLERIMDKREILEAYINTVYFGAGAYGIEAAAQTYYSKGADQLTIAEAALLAGVIKSPVGYAPHINPDRAQERRGYVLSMMESCGMITQQEKESAAAQPVQLAMADTDTNPYGWYMDGVLREAQEVLALSADEILSGGLRIYTGFDENLQTDANALFENGARFPDPAADGTPAQAALVCMDTQTGEIRCMVGGREYSAQRALNRATQTRRQPGSAIKPVSTYAAAIDDHGYLPSDLLMDEQRVFEGGYSPGNAGGSFYGAVTLREAVSRSLNAATVNLADQIGVRSLRKYMQRFHLPLNPQDVNLSLALGSMTDGVSPAELCAAYCALANGGTAVRGHLIRKIEAADGRSLYAYSGKNESAVSAQSAYLLTDVLMTAATKGSAKALAGAGMTVAGKTGTVSEPAGGTRDIWTAAYTPQLAVTVWMGFDQPDGTHALPDSAGGSGYPARLCAAFLKNANLADQSFDVPDGLVNAQIDTAALADDGRLLLASADTPQEYCASEWFTPDRVPDQVSDYWQAPRAIDDLTLIEETPPWIAFTARDSGADYLVIRTIGGESEIAAVLNGQAGEMIVWCDPDIDTACEYSVIPRHRAMYQSGTLLMGPESARVRYAPKGWIERIFS